jgi:hypothetical protein
MSLLWFGLLAVICWQPLYLGGKAVFHLIKRDTWDATGYWNAFQAWFKQLVTLVFSKPGV